MRILNDASRVTVGDAVRVHGLWYSVAAVLPATRKVIVNNVRGKKTTIAVQSISAVVRGVGPHVDAARQRNRDMKLFRDIIKLIRYVEKISR